MVKPGKKPPANNGRREFIKGSIAATAVPLVITSIKSEAQVAPALPPSPSTVGYEWTRALPIPQVLAQTPLEDPVPTGPANSPYGECGRNNHQKWGTLYSRVPETYEVHVQEATHSFTDSPAIPPQPIWGYNGTYPGPTIHARYGKPVIMRFFNNLPQDHVGFGSPEISTHLHNLHCGSESDGFPGDYFSPTLAGPTLTSPGMFKDHLYPNVYAGFEDFPDTDGDPREALGTLWFHDHTLDSTAANVYKGLAAFYLLFDKIDSGDENDPNPEALRLPSGEYDIPIVVQDKRFAPNGQLYWNQLDPEGVLGDKIVVNGVIQPRLDVARRKYRFRFLNGGPTHLYELYFIVRGTSQVQSFTYVANDGNLLPAPLASSTLRTSTGASPHGLRLGVAERSDIVFDFSRYSIGTEILVINRLKQTSTRKQDTGLLTIAASNQVMLIKVDRDPPGGLGADPSRVPTVLRPLPDMPADLSTLPVRRWVFERSGGAWIVNGRSFNINQISAAIPKGSAEIWDLVNPSGGWTHPIHIHFEEGRILQRFNSAGVSVVIPPQERGRKDVYVLNPGERIRVFLRFRDFVGKHPMHCHNLAHEDHAMMVRWDITE